MKCKIIENATEMFLNLGFKSVTMDDIANEGGMSKKTIYQYFKNKTELVDSCVNYIFEYITKGIACVQDRGFNAIEEQLEIKAFVQSSLKNEKTSPFYQLQKYYPKIFVTLKERQFQHMQNCLLENLKKGIETGLYRESINIDIISRLHFNSIVELKNTKVFPPQKYNMTMLMETFLDYHLRAICTPKGIEILEALYQKQTS